MKVNGLRIGLMVSGLKLFPTVIGFRDASRKVNELGMEFTIGEVVHINVTGYFEGNLPSQKGQLTMRKG